MANQIKLKHQLLRDQNGQCAFCGHVFPVHETTYHHKQSGVVVCKPCSPMIIQVIASAGRFGGTEPFFAKLATFMATIHIKTGEINKPVTDDGTWLDEQGRRVDRDGNIYDDKGIILGNIHDGE